MLSISNLNLLPAIVYGIDLLAALPTCMSAESVQGTEVKWG